MAKPKVAFFDFACCEGCQLQIANIGELLLDVLGLIDVVEFREVMSEKGPDKIDVAIGDPVKITDGPFKDFDGKISEIDEARGKIKVLVSMFGRETPVELDFLQVKKL